VSVLLRSDSDSAARLAVTSVISSGFLTVNVNVVTKVRWVSERVHCNRCAAVSSPWSHAQNMAVTGYDDGSALGGPTGIIAL